MEIRTDFFRTIPGCLKALEFVFSFVGLVFYLIENEDWVRTEYFIGIIVAILVAVTIVVFYLSGIAEPLGPIIGLQTYFHLIWMFYMIRVASLILNEGGSNFAAVCEGVFGLLLALTYLVDGIYGFRTNPPMPFRQ